MNTDELLSSFESLKIPKTHLTVGLSNLIASQKHIRSLFVNRRLPDNGWSDVEIQSFLYLLSTLDTNNKTPISNTTSSSDSRWCGVGEREARVYSSLVAQRHFGLSHGVGRSGDITEPQPKAVGSSIMAKLALLLTMDAIKRGSGINEAKHGILLPLCTGMSMSLVLSAIRDQENDHNKNVVLWSRIDQKSCFKAVLTAGLECVVVPTKLDGDAVVTNLDAMAKLLTEYQRRILAVITTTSCFAPRVPDLVDQVAKLCQSEDVAHIVNNAYGLQCKRTSKLINRACVVGRVDAIVCSTDKNFLVPVGGAIVISPKENVIRNVGKVYAGRASSSPLLDLFVTLLSMGLNGYKRLLSEREGLLDDFRIRLGEIAEKHGERLIHCPSNTISYGITLDRLGRNKADNETEEEHIKSISKDISYFGSMLFKRCVSGTRVIPRGETKVMAGTTFEGFGSSTDSYPHAYMTAACAIGVSKSEVTEFFSRLDKTVKEFKSKTSKK